jgi:uncharacterized protein
MTSELLAPCPFLAGPMITDSQFFVGRQVELDAITSRMTGYRPISINIVGKRRIGKSSLLYHFLRTHGQRVENPSRYVVIYLNLQDSQYHNEIGFYHGVARQLLAHPSVKGKRALIKPFNVKSIDRLTFAGILGEWKRQGVLPVLCLDEFEALFHHAKEFDNGFFENLRYLINSNILMLVVASHRPLDFYRRRYRLTSSFFNFEQILPLGELTLGEARELINLPAKTNAPALSSDEQRLVKEWGGCHPFLLQLAASCLWEARQREQDLNWAQAKFEQQARRVPKPLWKIPPRLDNFVRSYSWVVMLILVVLLVVGVLNQTQVFEGLGKALRR